MNLNEKQKALSELSTLIATLKNPQCHYDLSKEDRLLLNIKLKEAEETFYVILNSHND